jgi:hypothetical protein
MLQEGHTSLKESCVFLDKRTPARSWVANRIPERTNIRALCEDCDCGDKVDDNSLTHKEENKPTPVLCCAKQAIHQSHERKSSAC